MTLLKDLPKTELPRERLITYGPSSLSNSELLSILFRTGTKGKSVKDLSENVLTSCKDITKLKDFSINKLKTIKGLGTVKSVTLLAALELGKRVYSNREPVEHQKIYTSLDAFRYFGKYITDKKQEQLLAIYLDIKRHFISKKIIFTGTINSSTVHPREVFKNALLENAFYIIIMHNHPSGDLTPSYEDDETTRIFAEVGNTIGIKLLDHLIVSESDYYSYIEDGRLQYVKN